MPTRSRYEECTLDGTKKQKGTEKRGDHGADCDPSAGRRGTQNRRTETVRGGGDLEETGLSRLVGSKARRALGGRCGWRNPTKTKCGKVSVVTDGRSKRAVQGLY